MAKDAGPSANHQTTLNLRTASAGPHLASRDISRDKNNTLLPMEGAGFLARPACQALPPVCFWILLLGWTLLCFWTNPSLGQPHWLDAQPGKAVEAEDVLAYDFPPFRRFAETEMEGWAVWTAVRSWQGLPVAVVVVSFFGRCEVQGRSNQRVRSASVLASDPLWWLAQAISCFVQPGPPRRNGAPRD